MFKATILSVLAALTLVAIGAGHALVRTKQAADRGRTAVGLAIDINNGVAAPLHVRRGQTFYLNQIDLRASVTATFDEGVAGLRTRGDFAGLAWDGITREEQEFVLLANPDRTFTRRAFFRGARWMNDGSTFRLAQLDAHGRVIGAPIVVNTGRDDGRHPSDDFFTRRFRAIQWTRDCRSGTDCAGAKAFEEEALVELRHALRLTQTFTIAPETTALRLHWSLRPDRPYAIPLTQVASPPFDYGFSIDVEPVTPPRADGTYAPGSEITFRLTLRDGAGARLHPVGGLPPYNEVAFGANPAGIQYYRAFVDPTATYWRRKHRERMLMATFIGPAQQAQPIRTIIDIDKFLGDDDVQVTGTLDQDGQHAEFRTFPSARDLFGGAFDPAHAGWARPVSDMWTHRVPANAPPGTYFLNVKGRRTWLGEDIPASRTVEIQIGSRARTIPQLTTGNCTACHTGPSSLDRINHANADRATCAGCHVPLGFELEGPIAVRAHFVHSRSRRVDTPLTTCAACHLTPASIQRTSKAACLSCHISYPQSHTAVFGAVESIYVGGGRESFQQCTTACHTTHPGSRF